MCSFKIEWFIKIKHFITTHLSKSLYLLDTHSMTSQLGSICPIRRGWFEMFPNNAAKGTK